MRSLLTFILALGTLFATTLEAQQLTPDEEAVAIRAEEWLALVDAEKYAESWDEFAPVFKAMLSAQQWEAAGRQVRSRIGPLRSRTVDEVTATSSIPGAPEGNYMLVRYESRFESLADAVETVVLLDGDEGGWLLAGYSVTLPQ